MAGIASLTEIYKKKGKDFIKGLFNEFVTVNEKLDASAFAVERDPQTNKLVYYKRNTDVPISVIDRTLMRYYEKPIEFFEGMSTAVLDTLPAGWRFGMEYFISESPQEIVYDRMPKNGLVLSYIHVRDADGNILRTIQSKDDLDEWADSLGVERAPIIFQGRLEDEQKVKILDFMETPFEQLSKSFKTESFVRHIVSVLNPKIKKMALNDNLDKSIEGIVFRFGEDENVVLAKLLDPVFETLSKEKRAEENPSGPNDAYFLTLLDLLNFIDNIDLKKFKPKGKTFDDRYLDFVCRIFNEFIDKFPGRYMDLDFSEPAFMKKPEFDVNVTFIKNDETSANIQSSDSYKKLFKILLASFRRKKKRASGIFNKEVMSQFNLTVDKIHAHLNSGLKEDLMESESSEIPTFGEFIIGRNQGEEFDYDEDKPEEETEEETKDLMSGMEDLMKEPDAAETPEEPVEKKEKKEKLKRVNIIVGRFQPPHNGHLRMASELNIENKLSTVLVVVHTGNNNNKAGTSPFSRTTMDAMLNNIGRDSGGIIDGAVFVNRGLLEDILRTLRAAKYEPVLWGVGEDRIDGYRKQVEFNFMKDNPLKLDPKFEVMLTERVCSGTDVRKAIEEGRFADFKKMVPVSVAAAYTDLRREIEANDKKES